jgi:hypothetical protein
MRQARTANGLRVERGIPIPFHRWQRVLRELRPDESLFLPAPKNTEKAVDRFAHLARMAAQPFHRKGEVRFVISKSSEQGKWGIRIWRVQ